MHGYSIAFLTLISYFRFMYTDRITDRILPISHELTAPTRYFGGTAYLGLSAHLGFQELLITNIRRWGTAYGASRLANIQLSAYAEAEAALQACTRMPAVRTVSSGMLAGKLAIEVLTPLTDRFFYLPNLHPALHAPHMAPVFLNEELNPDLLDDELERITILTDCVPAFQVNPVDLSFLSSISASKIITLVMDESHSLGLLGEKGGGVTSQIQDSRIVRTVMVASLGKAMGVTGGMIASDEAFINLLQTRPDYIGAAGMNPAMAQTLADGMAIIAEQRLILEQHLHYFFSRLQAKEGTDVNDQIEPPRNSLSRSMPMAGQEPFLDVRERFLMQPNYPVLYPKRTGLYEHLRAHQIVITHFEYATGDLDRIVLAAHHQKADLDALLRAIDAWE
jgi:7-keto-8-aminopelargonate synthetase-like enzyme